jgi:sugar phosphate isomerase/epimerase
MKFSRRKFIATSAAASVALTLPGQIMKTAQAANSITDKLGLILGTIKDEMKEDWKAALKKVADTGYKYIEGGVYGDSTEEYLKTLKELGLSTIATGSSLYPLTQEPEAKMKTAKELGAEYFICYWPWLDSAENLDEKQVMDTIKEWHKIGKIAMDNGLKFGIHNHDKEFKIVKGEPVYDMILKNTAPELVMMELDLYWIIYAGYDPLDYFEKYPGRFELFHVKDMDDTEEKARTCVGNGVIDFAKIFAQADKAGMKYPIVEQEANKNGYPCIVDSFNHLANLSY